ncbi:aldo/keto reductase [Celeribacter arenosi]|uniref:Aldo/keto reductase n=1 Tax=Celeribacter arenosi TaxID=792649 RepID=A0ABP7K996_9RHOB
MRMRKIGKSDLEVSELCLGTMTWGTQNTTAEGHAQIDHAKAAGINFMDTAEMYPVNPVRKETVGDTETIIGKYFAERGDRADWILATKIAGPSGFIGPEGITPQTLEARLDLSLKRLQTDYVDLYQLHWPNRGSYHFRQMWNFDPTTQPPKAEVLDNMRAVNEKMAELQKAGKVREFGTSNESAWGMAQWLRIAEETGGPRMQSIQNEYSLMCRYYDLDLAELAVHEEITLLPYSCLACGMLTGKYDGGKTVDPKSRLAVGDGTLGGRANDRAWAAVDAYTAVAQKHGLNPTSMAIAWIMTRPFEAVPILGATSVEQLQMSIDAEALTLSDAVVKELNALNKTHPLPF